MTEPETFDSICGYLLLAVPSMADPFFSQTVTLICEHTAEGAMGLVINQPTDVRLQEVFEQLSLDAQSADAMQQPIGYGGPVSRDQGFVLHTTDKIQKWSASEEIMDGIELTASQDIIDAISKGQGPKKWKFILGYAGWGAGQLESELAGDSWITTPATEKLIFDTPAADQLKLAASDLGVDLSRLGTTTGSA